MKGSEKIQLQNNSKMRPIGTSGSVTGGSSGSFEQLGFEKKSKIESLDFPWLVEIRNVGSNGSHFEPLDSKT